MPAPNLTIISNQHANTPNTPNPWITLLELDIPANGAYPEAHLYVCQADTDIVYQGQVYKAFDFDFPELENKPGELPQFQVQLSNVNKMAHSLLEQYRGGVDGVATFMIVSSIDLEGASPAQQWQFKILSATAKDTYATISLGGENPMRRQFPTQLFLVDHCGWTYNSPIRRAALDPTGCVCAYQGTDPTCDHTLNGADGCVAHGNATRFGGAPGISSQGFRTATVE